MAGTLVIDTLKSSTTGAPAFQNTSGVEVGQLCRAWVNFAGSTATIRASFNVSSVTRNGTGDYTLNFTNALADGNYAAGGMGTNGTNTWGISVNASFPPTSTAFRIRAQDNTAFGDPTYALVAVFR